MLTQQPKKSPRQDSTTIALVIEYLSLEELIGHARKAKTNPGSEIVLNNTKVFSPEEREDFYAAVNKRIHHVLGVLKKHHLDHIQIKGDEPYIKLVRTIQELHRQRAVLLEHRNVSEQEKAALRAAAPAEEQIALLTLDHLINVNQIIQKIVHRMLTARQAKCKSHAILWHGLGLPCLSENSIEQTAKIVEASGLAAAITLNRNALKYLPNSIVKFQGIGQLHLDDNQLVCLPNNIGDIRSIYALQLNNNQIENLPSSIWKLKSLIGLGLTANSLKSWPEYPSDDIIFLTTGFETIFQVLSKHLPKDVFESFIQGTERQRLLEMEKLSRLFSQSQTPSSSSSKLPRNPQAAASNSSSSSSSSSSSQAEILRQAPSAIVDTRARSSSVSEHNVDSSRMDSIATRTRSKTKDTNANTQVLGTSRNGSTQELSKRPKKKQKR